MTKAEALYCMKANSVLHSEICEECPLYGDTGVDHCFEDALDEAIKALEQEPCEDCVSRQAALDALEWKWAGKAAFDAIKELPPVNPQPKTGHWIKTPGMNECCDVCGHYFPLSDFAGRPFEINHCPACGVKMVEPQESEYEE